MTFDLISWTKKDGDKLSGAEVNELKAENKLVKAVTLDN